MQQEGRRKRRMRWRCEGGRGYDEEGSERVVVEEKEKEVTQKKKRKWMMMRWKNRSWRRR